MSAPTFASALIDATCPRCGVVGGHHSVCDLDTVSPTTTTVKADPVAPRHYKDLKPEPIEAIEGWSLGFNLGNAVKYIARAELKGSPLDDLRKARWYLDREIELRTKAGGR